MRRNIKITIFNISAILVLVAAIVGAYVFFNNNSDKTKDGLLYALEQPSAYDQPLTISLGDTLLSILPLDARAANYEEVEGQANTVVYRDAYVKTDIVQTREVNKLKEDIVLKSPGHPMEFRYQLNMENFDIRRDRERNFVFYPKGATEDLNKLFMIPAPFLIDANGLRSSPAEVHAQITKEGILILRPDAGWLKEAAYPVILDPTVEISVINLHSHPWEGDLWVVDFVTRGQSDLSIIPEDQATINDDEFVSLTCNGEERTPQILNGDVIYYPDWQCDGVGQVVHSTIKAGSHTLRFEFGGQIAYAFNSVPAFESYGTESGVITDTSTPAYPTVVNKNDILIVAAISGNDNTDIVFPSDWNEVAESPDSDPTGAKAAWAWKRADGSETGTINVTQSGNTDQFFSVMGRYSGVIATGTPFDSEYTRTMDNVNFVTSTAITTLGKNRLGVVLTLIEDNRTVDELGYYSLDMNVDTSVGSDAEISFFSGGIPVATTISEQGSNIMFGNENAVSFTFDLIPAADEWWDGAWGKKQRIYYSTENSATTTDLLNFPVSVQLNSSRIDYSYTQDSGEDIRFVHMDGSTELNYEIEEWNESGTSTIWVNVPRIAQNASNTHIWMYYDNEDATDNSTTTGVWNDNYMIVQHLQETTTGATDFKDSTRNYVNSTAVTIDGAGSDPDATGLIDGAVQFDGSDDTIAFADSSGFSPTDGGGNDLPLSLSFWVNPDSLGGGDDRIMGKYDSSDAREWEVYTTSGQVYWVFFNYDTYSNRIGRRSSTELSVGSWNYINLTYDGSEASTGINVYSDGADADTADYNGGTYTGVSDTGSTFRLARIDSGSEYWQGYLDEIRVMDIEQSDDWIEFEYCNMVETCNSYEDKVYNYWEDDTWKSRFKVYFDTTSSATTTDLIDFPAAILLNSDRIDYSLTQDNGEDVRFYDPDGTALQYEIESWDETGTSTLWVKVPQIDASSTADYVWLYYNNETATDNSTTTGVWNDDYVFVHHLQETTTGATDFKDSTKGGHDSIAVTLAGGSSDADAEGKLNGAVEFDISGQDLIDLGDHADFSATDGAGNDTPLSISLWTYHDTHTAYGFIAGKYAGSPDDEWDIYISSSGILYFELFEYNSYNERISRYANATPLPENAWSYLTFTYDGSEASTGINIYLNGQDIDDTDWNSGTYTGMSDTDAKLQINTYEAGGNHYDGIIDEFRFSSDEKSDDWIEFAYCNMNDTCNSYGAYEFKGWRDYNWDNRRKIVFDTTGTATSTDLVEFPFAVLLNSERIDYSKTQDNGEDIRFYDSTGAALNYEIEEWDETGTSTIWVKVPQIDANSDVDYMYMYYNNIDATDNSTTTGVWNEDYLAVWHMNDSAVSDQTDSTRNGLDATPSGGPTASTTAMLAGGMTFDGDNDYLETASFTHIYRDFTLSAWYWSTDAVVGRPVGGPDDEMVFFHGDGTRQIDFGPTDDNYPSPQSLRSEMAATSTSDVTDGNSVDIVDIQWHYLTVTREGDDVRIIVDAVQDDADYAEGTSGSEIYVEDSVLWIGDEVGSTEQLHGTIDELRIADAARNFGWIEFEYCNMQAGCNTYEAEETRPNTAPTFRDIIDSPDPVNQGSSISFDFDWYDAEGDIVKAKLCKTNGLTSQNCDGGYWASSTVFTPDDPETLQYYTTDSDTVEIEWYGYVCDDFAGACSYATSGTTTINASPSGSGSGIKLRSGTWKINYDDISGLFFVGIVAPWFVFKRKKS